MTGALRRAIHRMAASDSQREAEELQQRAVAAGAVPVADVPDRARAWVAGTIRTVTLRPVAGVPALEAEVYDGSGSLIVIFLGRRSIPGIDLGRDIAVSGRISRQKNRVIMYNPRYELLPRGLAP